MLIKVLTTVVPKLAVAAAVSTPFFGMIGTEIAGANLKTDRDAAADPGVVCEEAAKAKASGRQMEVNLLRGTVTVTCPQGDVTAPRGDVDRWLDD